VKIQVPKTILPEEPGVTWDSNVSVQVAEKVRKKRTEEKSMSVKANVGLDVGTAFLVSARRKGDAVEFKKVRNAFIDVPSERMSVSALERQNVSFVVTDDRPLVVGDHALKLAAILQRTPRRPLCSGIISPNEKEAFPVLYRMIESIVGKPVKKGEDLLFSIPAPAHDDPTFNTTFHEEIFTKILAKLGYTPQFMTEGLAATYATVVNQEEVEGDEAPSDFQITVSMGAGMCNIAITYLMFPVAEFSIPFGGDWLDLNVSKALDIALPICIQKKEAESFSLEEPETDIAEAYVAYYRALLDTLIKAIEQQIIIHDCAETTAEPVAIHFVGGSTKPKGFRWLIHDVFSKWDFPVEIQSISTHEDAERLVAQGLLTALEVR